MDHGLLAAPMAFRSLSRPSSAISALASTLRSFSLDLASSAPRLPKTLSRSAGSRLFFVRCSCAVFQGASLSSRLRDPSKRYRKLSEAPVPSPAFRRASVPSFVRFSRGSRRLAAPFHSGSASASPSLLRLRRSRRLSFRFRAPAFRLARLRGRPWASLRLELPVPSGSSVPSESSDSSGPSDPFRSLPSFPFASLPRKEVIQRTFRYGYLVTTSPQSIGLTFDGCPLSVSSPASGAPKLPWCDGRCVQGPGTYSPRHADPRLLATPTSCGGLQPTVPN